MSESEKLAAITATVQQFAREYWERLCWQAGQLVPGADSTLGERLPAKAWKDPLPYMMEAQEWLVMAKAGAGLLPKSDDLRYEVREICQGLAEWLFAVPGAYTYQIPDFWAETDMGRLWWAAQIWVEGDELITQAEAAELAGVTVQAISARVSRGTLRSFTDPTEPNPQRQKRVRKSDIPRTAKS